MLIRSIRCKILSCIISLEDAEYYLLLFGIVPWMPVNCSVILQIVSTSSLAVMLHNYAFIIQEIIS